MSIHQKTIPDHVEIPVLSGIQVRKMLRHAGETGAAYARFNEHSRTWTYQCVFNQRIVPTKYIESLYLLLGHDRFWSAYTAVVPQPTESPSQQASHHMQRGGSVARAGA